MEQPGCGNGTNGAELDPRNSAGGASELFVDFYARPQERHLRHNDAAIVLKEAVSIVIDLMQCPNTETLL